MDNFGNLYFKRSLQLRAMREKRLSQFKRIVGSEPELETEAIELTTMQFITAALLYQTNIYHIITFIDILARNSGVVVFIVLFLVDIFVSLPLITLFIFMSSYSKKGFIKFWDCVPLFAGIGYSILLCRLTYAVFHVYFTIPPLLLFIKSLSVDDHMRDLYSCKHAAEGSCYPMNPKYPYNVTCSASFAERGQNETIFPATQYHYRFQIMYYNRHITELLGIYPEFIMCTFFIWSLIFIIAVFGVNRIGKFILNLQMCINFCSFLIVMYGLILSHDPIVSRPMEGSLSQIEFWVEILIHAADVIVISDMIYIGTLKPKSLTPIKAGVQVGLAKYIFFMTIMVYTQRCSQLILGHYKFVDTRCLIIFGHDVMFSFIPDVLFRVRFGVGYALLWYLVLFWTNINMLVFTTIGCVSAILEKFGHLRNYRGLIYLGYCLIGFIGNLYFCTNLAINTIYTYRSCGDTYYTTICLIITTFALMFVYSTKRISEDYKFTYGVTPSKYWIAAWQTASIVALFSFIFMIYEITHSSRVYLIFGAILWSYVHCIIIIFPICMQFLSKCCKHVKYGTLNVVTKPSDNWGPHNTEQRTLRRFYYPQRDVRYRNDVLICQHTCIANSDKYLEEKRKQILKWHKLMCKIQDERTGSQINLLFLENPS